MGIPTVPVGSFRLGSGGRNNPRHPAHTTSRHPLLYRESDIQAVMILRDGAWSPFCGTATVWLRIGYTFEISAILHWICLRGSNCST